MRRLILCLLLPLLLAACGAEPVWAPDDAVRKATFVSGEAPSVTLYTVISKNTGAGGHSSLLIDGRERILFDPAGTWQYPYAPERNDVHYGMTEQMRKFYIDYHAREDWYVNVQKVSVPLEVAEELRRRVEAYGAVPKSMCANSVSSILMGVPGFEAISHTYFPVPLSKMFSEVPGVVGEDVYDGDPRNVHGIKMIQPEKVVHGRTIGG